MTAPARGARDAGQALARALVDALGPNLVAVYLHGSAVLGGFRQARSDLDILALAHGPLDDEELDRIAGALPALHYPANGLEFTLMTAAEAAQPTLPAPRFQVHLTTTGWDHRGNVVDGREHAGDPDLVLHLAVCRAHGYPLVGPPSGELIGLIPEDAIQSAMRDEVRWAKEHAPREYLVLTVCRAWFFVVEGRFVSKLEAGDWAARRYPEPAAIGAALSRQTGSSGAEMTAPAIERLVAHVEGLIGAHEPRSAGQIDA